MNRSLVVSIVLVIVSLVMVAGILLSPKIAANEVTITLTENGFVPQTVNITRGDTATFVSTIGQEFWPASDAHPTHGLFPDFDANEPIAADKSWSFTFNELGSFSYHDHLKSQFTGVINVYSRFGQATTDCIVRSDGLKQEECWMDEFQLAHQNGGFDKVFALFSEYQKNDALFASNCHDIMHLLGDLAYEDYTVTGEVFDQPETAYCEFGFYHGFIERMIEETGDYTLSRQYCERLYAEGDFASDMLAKDAEGACVHGFGHAIFDSLDGSLWGNEELMVDAGLRICEMVFEGDFYLEECGTGIWNALAIAHVNAYYELGYEKDSLPFAICVQTKDIYKPGCYVEMVVQYSHWNGHTIDYDFFLLKNIVEPIAQPKTYFSYVSDVVQWRLPFGAHAHADFGERCFALADETHQDACLYGIHRGILKRTSPYTHENVSLAVCERYQESDKRTQCESTIPKKL